VPNPSNNAQERKQASTSVGSVQGKCNVAMHAMKTYWGVEVWFHILLTSALD
jgi:hypothetical protein